jgi:ABC-type glutathione transport system ATPase component
MIEPLRVQVPRPTAVLVASAAEMLEMVGMPRSGGQVAHEFSGGRRQRTGPPGR